MKKLLLLFVVMIFVVGCNGVNTNAEYKELLDQTTALAEVTADKAEAGTLTCDEMKVALRYESNVLKQFKNANDGVSK